MCRSLSLVSDLPHGPKRGECIPLFLWPATESPFKSRCRINPFMLKTATVFLHEIHILAKKSSRSKKVKSKNFIMMYCNGIPTTEHKTLKLSWALGNQNGLICEKEVTWKQTPWINPPGDAQEWWGYKLQNLHCILNEWMYQHQDPIAKKRDVTKITLHNCLLDHFIITYREFSCHLLLLLRKSINLEKSKFCLSEGDIMCVCVII